MVKPRANGCRLLAGEDGLMPKHIAGGIRRHFIRISVGDAVNMEMSP